MTAAARLQPYVVAFHRQSTGMLSADPAHQDFHALFRDDAEALAYARAEVARMAVAGRRTLASHDHESGIRSRALKAMLDQHEKENK